MKTIKKHTEIPILSMYIYFILVKHFLLKKNLAKLNIFFTKLSTAGLHIYKKKN